MEYILKSYPQKGYHAYAALIDIKASMKERKVVVDYYDNGTPIDYKDKVDCYRLSGGGKFHYRRFELADGDYRCQQSNGFGTRHGERFIIRIANNEIEQVWDSDTDYIQFLHFRKKPELPTLEGVSRRQVDYAEAIREKAIARNPQLLSEIEIITSAREILDKYK